MSTRVENILLSRHSNYRIGGFARFFREAATTDDIMDALIEARDIDIPLFILGGGTNILFNDYGLDAFVLKIANNAIAIDGVRVRADAGVCMSDLLRFCVERGVSGLEWAGGLPGTLGGAIRGNAGAFGGEIKDVVEEVTSVDVATGVRITRNARECDFQYRNSIYKQLRGKEIIVEAVLALQPGTSEDIERAIANKINYRKERHPIEYPNIGSIFKNIAFETFPKEHYALVQHIVKTDPLPVVPAAFILSETGLKGVRWGGAVFSSKHPNFIVNDMKAISDDVKKLIQLAKKDVAEKFGIELEEEIEYA